MMTDTQRVHFYDCRCDWRTKYCDEFHVRSVSVPTEYLRSLLENEPDDV